MTQYTEMIEAERTRQSINKQAREWAKGIKYILAENGYIETKFNSGKVMRVWHRDNNGNKAGKELIMAKGKPFKDIRIDFERAQADQISWNERSRHNG